MFTNLCCFKSCWLPTLNMRGLERVRQPGRECDSLLKDFQTGFSQGSISELISRLPLKQTLCTVASGNSLHRCHYTLNPQRFFIFKLNLHFCNDPFQISSIYPSCVLYLVSAQYDGFCLFIFRPHQIRLE